MGKKNIIRCVQINRDITITKRKVRVVIIGVGNCASALVQDIHFYQNAPDGQFIPGLMNSVLGG
jgi:myo-inositol-1-phosphate synthase